MDVLDVLGSVMLERALKGELQCTRECIRCIRESGLRC